MLLRSPAITFRCVSCSPCRHQNRTPLTALRFWISCCHFVVVAAVLASSSAAEPFVARAVANRMATCHRSAALSLSDVKAVDTTMVGALPKKRSAATGLSRKTGFFHASVGCLVAVMSNVRTVRRAGSRMAPHARLKQILKKKDGVANVARIRDRHIKAIVVAVKTGGGLTSSSWSNPRLDRAIKAALKDNVPRSAIDGRLKKASDEELVELTMQGYSQGGAAVIVECVGSNEAALREFVTKVFTKCGAKVGRSNCVDVLFKRQGTLRFEGYSEDEVLEASMDAEVEDFFLAEDGVPEVATLPDQFHTTLSSFEEIGVPPSSAQVETLPLSEHDLSKGDAYETLRLLVLLEELDGVQTVQSNANLPDDLELANDFYGNPRSWEWVEKNPELV